MFLCRYKVAQCSRKKPPPEEGRNDSTFSMLRSVKMSLDVQQAASLLVDECLEGEYFLRHSRFDVYKPLKGLRVYGRVTKYRGESVTMIQSIEFPRRHRGKGLFNALCSEFRRRNGHRIYVQCVGNEDWFTHMENSPMWTRVGHSDFIQSI